MLLSAFAALATEWSGRASLRWYQITNTLNGDINAPALRLRMNAYNLLMPNLNFSFYYRGEKDLEGDRVTKSRLYDMRLQYAPTSSGIGFDLGRINSSFVGAYGILDGASLYYKLNSVWTTGTFWGLEPDLLTLALKSDVQRTGAFVAWDLGRMYQGTTSAIYQTFKNQTDRFYLYLDQDLDLSTAWQFSQFAELDILERKGGTINTSPRLTNMFADLRYAPSRVINATLTYNSRKEFKYMASMSDLPDSLFDSVVSSSYGLRVNVRPLRDWRLYSGFRTGERDDRAGREEFVYGGLTQNGLFLDHLFLNLRYGKTFGWYAESSSWYISAEHPVTSRIRLQTAFHQAEFQSKTSTEGKTDHAADLVLMYRTATPLYIYMKWSHRWGSSGDENRYILECSYNLRRYNKNSTSHD